MTTVTWIATVLGLAGALAWGGPTALLIAALLIVMEVSLSFDNAVVNATVLRQMDPKWQRRFLTWGILVAVFGMRLVFPVLIVAVAAGVGLVEVARMAVSDPAAYAAHLKAAHVGIAAFGGMFLLMVFLHFVFDQAKEVHWLGWVERRLAAAGRLEAVGVAVALGVLLLVQLAAPEAERLTAMVAGVTGRCCRMPYKTWEDVSATGTSASVYPSRRSWVPAYWRGRNADARPVSRITTPRPAGRGRRRGRARPGRLLDLRACR